MNSQNSRPITELFGDAISQLGKLVGNEFALARAEISEKAAQASRAGMMIGMGAVIMIPALVILLFAASAALVKSGLSEPVAHLLTGGTVTVVAISLIAIGMGRLSGDALKPSVMLEQVQRDKSAVEEMVR